MSARTLFRKAYSLLQWAGLDLFKYISLDRADIYRLIGPTYRLIGKSELPKSQQNLLELMRVDNQKAPMPFHASDYWIMLSRQFDDWFRIEGIKDVEDQFYNTKFSGANPTNYKYHQYAMWMLYSIVKQKDRYNILKRLKATLQPESGRSLLCEGNLLSWDLLLSIDTLYSISELDDSIFQEPVVVVDLGAGYGRLGYALKSINPKCTYIVCDLPETLLISSSYLPRLLPHEAVFSYEENRRVPCFTKSGLVRGGGLRFCGTQDLARFEDNGIDFFVNVASFQEMTKEQVGKYLEIVDRKTQGFFYAQELWSAKRHGLEGVAIAGIDEYAFPAHWKRHYLRNTSFSEKNFEAGYQVP